MHKKKTERHTRKWIGLLLTVCMLATGCGATKETNTLGETEAGTVEGKMETAETESIPIEETDEAVSESTVVYDSSQYEFLLYQKAGEDEVPLIGFNIPNGYGISNFTETNAISIASYGSTTEKYFNTTAYLLFLKDLQTGDEYLFEIGCDPAYGYEVSSDNILSRENTSAPDNVTTVEKVGEYEGPLGTMDLYFETTEHPEDDHTEAYTDHAEIALLPSDNNNFYIRFEMVDPVAMYADKKNTVTEKETTYAGNLERLLPELFLPADQSANQLPSLTGGTVTVGPEYDYTINAAGEDTAAIGLYVPTGYMVSVSGGWNDSILMLKDQYTTQIEITAKKADLYRYFKRNNKWLNSGFYQNYENVLHDVREVGETDTHFGKAKLYYVEWESLDGSSLTNEEEIALLNNNGVDVLVIYRNTNAPCDGEYDAQLEALLPELFG